jgi:hypothetical protein
MYPVWHTFDSNPYIGLLNHTDIVPPIPNGKTARVGLMVLHHLHYFSLTGEKNKTESESDNENQFKSIRQ